MGQLVALTSSNPRPSCNDSFTVSLHHKDLCLTSCVVSSKIRGIYLHLSAKDQRWRQLNRSVAVPFGVIQGEDEKGRNPHQVERKEQGTDLFTLNRVSSRYSSRLHRFPRDSLHVECEDFGRICQSRRQWKHTCGEVCFCFSHDCLQADAQ